MRKTLFIVFSILLFAASTQAQFADRITRPCSAGATPRAEVITNPNSTGNVTVTTCTGGALTVNGTAVVPGGATQNPTNGLIPYRSAAGVFSDSPLTRSSASLITSTAGFAFTLDNTLDVGVNNTTQRPRSLFFGTSIEGPLHVLRGATSGGLTIKAPAVAGTNTLTFPAGTTDFSATGGASQVVKQVTAGSAFTVARLACADLSDATAGCSGTAPAAAAVTVVDDTTTNATMFPLWVTANTGNLPVKVTSSKFTFNPSTGILDATGGRFSNLTSGRVTLNGTAGLLTDDADLTFSTDTLTATKFSGPTVGVITNSNAAAGQVGELVSSSVAAPGSAITTATVANVTTISLTAGDWDVAGVVGFTPNATTNITQFAGGVSTTSATFDALGSFFSVPVAAYVPNNAIVWALPVTRVSIAATTTVYLVAFSVFTVDVNRAYGFIRARRIR